MTDPFIPTVTFDIAPLDMEGDMFYRFATKSNASWKGVMQRVYPELLSMIAEAKDEADGRGRCRDFVAQQHAVHGEVIEIARAAVQSEWDMVGPQFLQALAEHFETDWPTDRPMIVGYMSTLPVYPRFLDTFSFCLGYQHASNVEISAHEILHFLWFKKWKEVFPEMERKTYETPHLVWRLSEIMDPIILQCHPKIKNLIKPKQWGYSSFKTIKIGDVSMTEHFKRVYEDAARANANFADILHMLWEEIQKHETEVRGF